jgi:hypothetical protein
LTMWGLSFLFNSFLHAYVPSFSDMNKFVRGFQWHSGTCIFSKFSSFQIFNLSDSTCNYGLLVERKTRRQPYQRSLFHLTKRFIDRLASAYNNSFHLIYLPLVLFLFWTSLKYFPMQLFLVQNLIGLSFNSWHISLLKCVCFSDFSISDEKTVTKF